MGVRNIRVMLHRSATEVDVDFALAEVKRLIASRQIDLHHPSDLVNSRVTRIINAFSPSNFHDVKAQQNANKAVEYLQNFKR